MTSDPADRLPIPAVLDLLVVVRLLYAARRHQGAPSARLQAIAVTGQLLRRAVTLAEEHSPGTLGHAAARARAEEACERLERMVGVIDSAEPLIASAVARVRGKRLVTLRKKVPER